MSPTFSNSSSVHDHGPVYSEIRKATEEFSFHPMLMSWLRASLELQGNETLKITEIGCTDRSCPVIETCLEIYHINQSTEPKRMMIRFGRAKHLISKMDLVFSLKKQGIVSIN
ncbi:hypothetical protein RBB68_18000 [Leptospira interrogans]|uniref:Uncharacterized protein n=14 Tax=Leptospira interrogans TaxID=173 RepID=Q8EXU8_LEPIN|nr:MULTISPECIES: hypothetical protein [Leptospira]EMF40459.1 hypothetical protein LEP1GSC067_2086 [Leptospira interrogans serovar Lora str. TE 1992]EMF74017.1 hypothetical protein LEP1GSC148_0154 [Leptospira interrogans serovar Canicola str. LT1962]EMG18965.1 hypothetical protein LEP1GSC150_1257 [Leptospira interrogans serovar Copenhageni str. LT2050]EMM80943.1 hypothetical protein LEP1GSC037_3352 [Leptospira interrogans str. 2006001854]EMN30223.1 hypothetical protein LEP1GSC083_2920 [Leptospi